jgi:hypothetical protein
LARSWLPVTPEIEACEHESEAAAHRFEEEFDEAQRFQLVEAGLLFYRLM